MNDGREFTDYRSSQVREEIFRYKNCLSSENETRTFRINNGDKIMDNEWNYLMKNKYCFPRKNCYHHNPKTLVSSTYNNGEVLAYNGIIAQPKCQNRCHHYRLTLTEQAKKQYDNCADENMVNSGYPVSRCPKKCNRSKRRIPDGLYFTDQELN
jgi:hypothetical protein